MSITVYATSSGKSYFYFYNDRIEHILKDCCIRHRMCQFLVKMGKYSQFLVKMGKYSQFVVTMGKYSALPLAQFRTQGRVSSGASTPTSISTTNSITIVPIRIWEVASNAPYNTIRYLGAIRLPPKRIEVGI